MVGSAIVTPMVCTPAPEILNSIVSAPGLALAASIASCNVQPRALHMPSPGSTVLSTVKVSAAALPARDRSRNTMLVACFIVSSQVIESWPPGWRLKKRSTYPTRARFFRRETGRSRLFASVSPVTLR
jgi:hypothetical protein